MDLCALVMGDSHDIAIQRQCLVFAGSRTRELVRMRMRMMEVPLI
jgi:hypothetical protein